LGEGQRARALSPPPNPHPNPVHKQQEGRKRPSLYFLGLRARHNNLIKKKVSLADEFTREDFFI
jgi:hypothetical protein